MDRTEPAVPLIPWESNHGLDSILLHRAGNGFASGIGDFGHRGRTAHVRPPLFSVDCPNGEVSLQTERVALSATQESFHNLRAMQCYTAVGYINFEINSCPLADSTELSLSGSMVWNQRLSGPC